MERKCRICGCSENDCRQCIEKTGKPCTWVEVDLCSACISDAYTNAQEYPAWKGDIRETTKEILADLGQQPAPNSSSTINTTMDFFKQLSTYPAGLDLTLRIKEKNGKLTISVLPNGLDQSAIQPLIVTGTPEDLDKEFFSRIGPTVTETVSVINAAEHRKSVQEATAQAPKEAIDKKATDQAQARMDEKKKEPKKPGPKKAAAKKAAPKEGKPKEEQPKEEVKPRIEEPTLF